MPPRLNTPTLLTALFLSISPLIGAQEYKERGGTALPELDVSEISPAAGRLILVLDTSSSMNSHFSSLQTSMDLLLTAYAESIPTSTGLTPKLILLTFPQPELQLLSIPDALDYQDIVSRLKKGGSREDGLAAIDNLLDAGMTDAQLLLVTDERRFEQQAIDWLQVLAKVRQQRVVVHLVQGLGRPRSGATDQQSGGALGYRFTSQDRTRAGGADNALVGINASGDISAVPASEQDKRSHRFAHTQYAKLAMHSGGNVWVMDGLPLSGKFMVESLISGLEQLIDRKVVADIQIIGQQRPGEMLTLDASELVYSQPSKEVHSWSWDWQGDGEADDFGPVINYRQQSSPEMINLMLELDTGEQLVQAVWLGGY